MIHLPKELADDLIDVCLKALPRQAYGLVGGRDGYRPQSIYLCSSNLRNTPEWKKVFDSFGDFYKNPDRGFVLDPEEQIGILEKMRARGETFVGVFHSHRWNPPVPTQADLALHVNPQLFCYIISVIHPERPELQIYRLEDHRHHEEIPYR